METLGEDLVLLSVHPDNGTIVTKSRLGYGLRGSELVRLAASGRAVITGDRIVVLDGRPTGDEQLDAALASLAGARRPPRPKTWVGHPGSRIVDTYLARLAAAGVIRADRRTLLGFIPALRWRVADTARLADTRARLDAIARAAGPVDTAQAAFAGLASASGLGPVLYPGMANRHLRKRLERIAKGELTQGAGRPRPPRRRRPPPRPPRTRRREPRPGLRPTPPPAPPPTPQPRRPSRPRPTRPCRPRSTPRTRRRPTEATAGTAAEPAAGTTSLASLCAQGPCRSGADLADQAAGHPAGQGRPGLIRQAQPGQAVQQLGHAQPGVRGVRAEQHLARQRWSTRRRQAGPAGAAPG